MTGRVARLEARRRRRRRLLTTAAAVTVAAAAVAALAGGALRQGDDVTETPSGDATPAASARARTMLLVRAPHEPGPAKGVTLFAVGPADGQAAVVLLPVGTLMDVPGHGLERLGAAFQYGGAALVEATVENTLGVDVDHSAAVSDAGLAALLGRVGPVEVDVDRRLVACLLYTSPSPRDRTRSRMPSSA